MFWVILIFFKNMIFLKLFYVNYKNCLLSKKKKKLTPCQLPNKISAQNSNGSPSHKVIRLLRLLLPAPPLLNLHSYNF